MISLPRCLVQGFAGVGAAPAEPNTAQQRQPPTNMAEPCVVHQSDPYHGDVTLDRLPAPVTSDNLQAPQGGALVKSGWDEQSTI